jgi:hypothetical protein
VRKLPNDVQRDMAFYRTVAKFRDAVERVMFRRGPSATLSMSSGDSAALRRDTLSAEPMTTGSLDRGFHGNRIQIRAAPPRYPPPREQAAM